LRRVLLCSCGTGQAGRQAFQSMHVESPEMLSLCAGLRSRRAVFSETHSRDQVIRRQ
jgi:hypothetical protein